MMTGNQLRFLLIDDSLADARVLEAHLAQSRPGGFELRHAMQLAEAMRELKEETFDCVFLDYLLEQVSGLEVLKAIRKTGNDVPVIMITGCGSEQVAVDALRLGAEDYLVKGDLTPHGVERALTNAICRLQCVVFWDSPISSSRISQTSTRNLESISRPSPFRRSGCKSSFNGCWNTLVWGGRSSNSRKSI